jgi:hypothetical protein
LKWALLPDSGVWWYDEGTVFVPCISKNPARDENMEEIEEIQQTLMKRIEEARLAGAKEFSRELRTSKAALKALTELLAEMRLSG